MPAGPLKLTGLVSGDDDDDDEQVPPVLISEFAFGKPKWTNNSGIIYI